MIAIRTAVTVGSFRFRAKGYIFPFGDGSKREVDVD